MIWKKLLLTVILCICLLHTIDHFGYEQPEHYFLLTRNGRLYAEDKGISGYQVIDNTSTKIYLYLETDREPLNRGIWADGQINEESEEGSTVILSYGPVEDLGVRYGISFISAEQAKKNLYRDIPTYDVREVADTGRKIWNETLGKITVEGGTEDEREIFYTSLYRTYERMINLSEYAKDV